MTMNTNHQAKAAKLQLEAERLRSRLTHELGLTLDERTKILERIKWCEDEAAWSLMAAGASSMHQHEKE